MRAIARMNIVLRPLARPPSRRLKKKWALSRSGMKLTRSNRGYCWDDGLRQQHLEVQLMCEEPPRISEQDCRTR